MKWIKTSERLPEEETDILLFTDDVPATGWLRNGKFFLSSGWLAGDVTHWAEIELPGEE